jgi:hypothetical protein
MTDPNDTFIDPTIYADKVSSMSSHIPSPFEVLTKFSTPLGDHIAETVKTHLREKAGSMTIEIAKGIFDGLSDILVETIGAVSLIGCTVLIILKIAGYDKGFKQAGLLFVLNLIVKYIFGGK